jgi:hypothetical protein
MEYETFNLEEPPPIQRASPVKARRTLGLFAQTNRSPAAPRSRDLGTVARPDSAISVWVGLVALVVVGVQGWLYHGVRRELAEQGERLEQTNKALAQVWETAQGLDKDRMQRLALLADSVRAELDATQGEVRLWEATYTGLEQRLDQKYRTLATTSRAEQPGRARLDALERQDRTLRSAFEALSRRTQTQESVTRDLSVSIASVRETLRKMDSAQEFGAATVGYGTLTRRVDNLSTWADGFRRVGMTGDALQRQLAILADELRRIRLRVDSLRPASRAVTSFDAR